MESTRTLTGTVHTRPRSSLSVRLLTGWLGSGLGRLEAVRAVEQETVQEDLLVLPREEVSVLLAEPAVAAHLVHRGAAAVSDVVHELLPALTNGAVFIVGRAPSGTEEAGNQNEEGGDTHHGRLYLLVAITRRRTRRGVAGRC